MRNKEKINKKRLAYGNVGERRFHEFLKQICKEMNLNVVRHPDGDKKVDFVVSDPESEKDILIEVERRKMEKWKNKFPYETVDFYGRRTIRKNCLEVVLNDPCNRSLIYSHDVIENYEIEKIYGPGNPYYARQISTKHSKEFSLSKDVDKIKDIIYNAMNGKLNNLNLNNKGKVNMSKETNMSDAIKWIDDNLSLAAQHLYYYRQIYSIKVVSKMPNNKIISPTQELLQSIRQVYNDNNKNSQCNVRKIIIDNWRYGAGRITDEIVNTLPGGGEFLADREKYGFVAKKYKNTFVSIWLQSVDVKDWWEDSIKSEDPINYIKEKIKQRLMLLGPKAATALVADCQIKMPVLKQSTPANAGIQESIAEKLGDTPKTSSSLSIEAFQLMKDIAPYLKNYTKECIDEAFYVMSHWNQ
jgi:hypothetical protein